MRRSLSIGGSSSVQWRKAGRSWRLPMCFRSLLCVRIEIDQLQCVNCWVIIHCLSVSCTKINHSRCALMIWSSLQLTSKQWIIKQQFTTGADLFLNYNNQTGFPSQIVLLWVTCWHRSIKPLKHLIIDTSYSLGSSDVITNVNTLTPINTFIFYENKRRIHGCLKWNYKRSVLIFSLLRIIGNFN